MASGDSDAAKNTESRGEGMTQPMIAALIAVGVVALALIAVLRLMRPRQVTLPDLPELPAPPRDENSPP